MDRNSVHPDTGRIRSLGSWSRKRLPTNQEHDHEWSLGKIRKVYEYGSISTGSFGGGAMATGIGYVQSGTYIGPMTGMSGAGTAYMYESEHALPEIEMAVETDENGHTRVVQRFAHEHAAGRSCTPSAGTSQEGGPGERIAESRPIPEEAQPASREAECLVPGMVTPHANPSAPGFDYIRWLSREQRRHIREHMQDIERARMTQPPQDTFFDR
jgi:hypothetical protein